MKKTKNKNFTTSINKLVKNVATTNNYALETTENVITEAVAVTGKWQLVVDKAIKGGFTLLDNQQKLVFDTLDSFKDQLIQGKERFKKIFA